MLASTCMVNAQQPHPERIYLSGTGVDDTRTWEFMCDGGMQSGKWRKIQVPSCWEQQGFGAYTYGRWYREKGAKPADETGVYRYRFVAPDMAKDERLMIYFDGVMTDTEVLINGEKAGKMHQGGFYRFSYDITSLIKPKSKNTLEVKVAKESANASINAAERKADWWLFGGIYRPVWLEVVPATYMRHYVIDADSKGAFKASIEMEGNTEGYSVAISIKDLKSGAPLLATNGNSSVKAPITGKKTLIESQWKDVKLWNPEDPNLYVATIQILDAQNKCVQQREVRTGFRTIEFHKQDGIYLNGTRLVVKGINRHSISVNGGRTTSAALSLEDAKLIKEMNMNAVRSHYPPDEHFLDMCDSLGILYMDELAGWQNCYDSKVGPALVKEMIERDVNHPCIMIWSNGNEGGWNYELDSLFAKYDYLQQRHVVHPWADFNDLDTHHYPAYLTGVARLTSGHKVFMPTEFMHSLYDKGGGAGLRDFWDRWLTNPMFAGGFIWAYCDEGIIRSDKNGAIDTHNYNAPDGVVGPQREKEGSFFAIRQQWSPILLKPLNINSHFNGSFLVTNEYLYTNLNQCNMEYRILKCGIPMQGDVNTLIVAKGKVTLPSINPSETGTARFTKPDNFNDGDVLELEAYDRTGMSIGTWSYPIRTVNTYLNHQLAQTPNTLELPHPAIATKDGNVVTLEAADIKVEFDYTTGMLRHVWSNDTEIPFNNGPVAVGMKMRYEQQDSYIRTEGGDAIYCAKYKGGADSIVWRLNERGILTMKSIIMNRASGGGGFDDAFMDTAIKYLGFSFSFPEKECEGMKWLGRGPYRVWKNRIAGTNYNIWQKDYNNTITGESTERLVYPEFQGYHGDMYWATLQNKQKTFTMYSMNDGLYYRIFTPKEPEGRAQTSMPQFPEGDISFLLEIPAIQSYKPIEQQGPNSQLGNIRIKSGDEGLHIDIMFDFR